MTVRPQTLVNLSRGNVVCLNAVVADRPLPRMRGLLGRAGLADDEGLLLKPAPSVHTAFMRFAIDVVFLDAKFRVLKVAASLMPWKAASARRARMALELPAGRAAARGLEVGDILELVDVTASTDAGENESLGIGRETPRAFGSGPRVVLVAPERRFRAVAGALLSQHGCDVRLGDLTADVAELARRETADVVVLDAGTATATAAREAARIAFLLPQVALVVVGEQALYGASAIPVLSKWDSFDTIYHAIEQARYNRERETADGRVG